VSFLSEFVVVCGDMGGEMVAERDGTGAELVVGDHDTS